MIFCKAKAIRGLAVTKDFTCVTLCGRHAITGKNIQGVASLASLPPIASGSGVCVCWPRDCEIKDYMSRNINYKIK